MIRSAIMAIISILLLLLPSVASAQQAEEPVIYRVPVTGVIEMGIAPFVARSIDEAAAAGATAVVLDIDTPGGRIDAAQQIVDAVSDADIPIYAYVNRRALSAGALIALATDGIYMRPGATLGAATPVTGDGEKASEKVVSAFRSEFRALAEERNLDPRIAEAMVDEDVAIPGVVESGKLLTLSTDRAERLGYAVEVEDWNALIGQIDAAGATIVRTEANWAEKVVRFLTNPLVAPFLLSLGFLGLLIELKTPTFGLAGLAGATALGLFFGSHLIVGLAGWEVVILIVLGIGLLLVEALVLPGFGIAGGLGALAIATSIFLSLIGNFPTTGDLLIAMNILGASVLIVGFVGWQLIRHLPHDRRAQNLLHRTSMTRERGYSSSVRRDELVGAEGVALTNLRPAGTAQFGDERMDVVTEGTWIEAGTPVRVVRSEGYRLVVTG
ncbi:MAG TPA: NfeD family protein [Longimicrobiaceae bacterium]|nr:NfeD family protein [Longimicrobiaceae bacterium]